MFEVIVTYRSDFSEHMVGRFATREEAQIYAQRLALENYEKIVRALVREVRQVKTNG